MRDTLDAYAAKLPKWGLAAALHRRKELGDEGTRNDARRARRSDGEDARRPGEGDPMRHGALQITAMWNVGNPAS